MAAAANANIARYLDAMARAQPQTAALKVPRGRTRGGDIDYLALSFAELDAEVGAWGAPAGGARAFAAATARWSWSGPVCP